MNALGLAMLLTLAAEPPRVEAELAFVYGFGSRSAFGGAATATVGWPAWESAGAAGTLEVGLLGGYQNEPYGPSAAYLAPTVVTGSNHRVEVFAVGGHTFRLLESRRLLVGLQLFAGWTHVSMRGAVTDGVQGFSGTYRADGAEFTFGVMVTGGVRVTERISVVARFILPLPYAGVALSSYFMASLGASVRF